MDTKLKKYNKNGMVQIAFGMILILCLIYGGFTYQNLQLLKDDYMNTISELSHEDSLYDNEQLQDEIHNTIKEILLYTLKTQTIEHAKDEETKRDYLEQYMRELASSYAETPIDPELLENMNFKNLDNDGILQVLKMTVDDICSNYEYYISYTNDEGRKTTITNTAYKSHERLSQNPLRISYNGKFQADNTYINAHDEYYRENVTYFDWLSTNSCLVNFCHEDVVFSYYFADALVDNLGFYMWNNDVYDSILEFCESGKLSAAIVEKIYGKDFKDAYEKNQSLFYSYNNENYCTSQTKIPDTASMLNEEEQSRLQLCFTELLYNGTTSRHFFIPLSAVFHLPEEYTFVFSVKTAYFEEMQSERENLNKTYERQIEEILQQEETNKLYLYCDLVAIVILLLYFFSRGIIALLRVKNKSKYTEHKYMSENILIVSIVVPFALGCMYLLGVIGLCDGNETLEIFLWIAISLTIICWIACLVKLYQHWLTLDKIHSGIHKVKAGEIKYQIETNAKKTDNLNHLILDINSLSDGLEIAVEEMLKSERMKTELISNVSHDIKTPLTSIITYVDLLKQEPIESEKAKEYIAVLDQKSQRLKTLTDDLFEAAKASSGAIPVEKSTIDMGALIQQGIGEFSEKFAEVSLEIRSSVENDMFQVYADGRLSWRILENIFTNVAKYALPNSRVYVDALALENAIQITVKNISGSELNISAEELMERFTRGERSRNTEGSGLGLNIAKELANLQDGNFYVEIDGDLFKSVLILPKALD